MATLDSSSPHHLNADRPMTKVDRVRWLVLNRLNNARAMQDLDPALQLRRFKAANAMSLWPKVSPIASPARRMSDLFWHSLPWQRLASELGGTVNAVEIGCGTGRYGVLIREQLGDAFGRYVGIDAMYHSDWEAHREDPRIRLVLANSNDTLQHLTGANLILTQSAIEHFDEDLAFFRLVARYIGSVDYPVVQIHLMPSAGCLSTFLWHGVRHYTPRTISLITRLFGTDTSKALYSLGGRHCNHVHRKFITYPVFFGRPDGRYSQTEAYDRALREAVQRDDSAPVDAEASFLAFVAQTRVSKDLLAWS